jgi:hypothetical protein
MKLIINIDEEDHHRIASGFGQEEDALLLEKIFKNGTPIPDNATNREVIKAIFPDCDETGVQYELTKNCNRWLNKPYQKGGKE